MQLQSPHALLPLPHERAQRLTSLRGVLLRARRGVVWVTVDHDRRDIVLSPGEEWLVDSSRPITVSALHGSALVELCDARLRRREERRRYWLDTLGELWNRDERSVLPVPARV